ncbi:hypothetical protein MNBD_GAMMA12-3523 [hydrothermal vent metagenome]|uniref:Uncharacterized protein n=1 Tax=hydrothermal vent metagenome TaxID=652676 RepID=A0A3B0YEQ4_9ZZZZ
MSNDEDPLLKKARQAEERAKRTKRKISSSKKKSGVIRSLWEMVSSVESLKKSYRVTRTFFRVLKKVTGPVGRLVVATTQKAGAIIKWGSFERETDRETDEGKPNYSFVGKVYIAVAGRVRAKKLTSNIFYQTQFKRDEEGDLLFSKNRLIKFFFGSIASLIIVHVSFSAVYFYSTQFTETIYTSGGKQELEMGDMYIFTGCTSLPCSTKLGNGKFYLVVSSWYFPVLVYPEEDVYAAIPPQDGACDLKGYGLYFKNLKFLHRTLQWYQKIYEVSCRPLTEKEKTRIINRGRIPTFPEKNSGNDGNNPSSIKQGTEI